MKCASFNDWKVSPAVCNLTCICAIFLSFFCYLLKCIWIRQSMDCIFWWVVFINSPCSISCPVGTESCLVPCETTRKLVLNMFLDIKAQFVDLRGLRSEYLRGFPGRENLANFPDLSCWGFDLVLESDSTSCAWMLPTPLPCTAVSSATQPIRWSSLWAEAALKMRPNCTGAGQSKLQSGARGRSPFWKQPCAQHRAAGTPIEREVLGSRWDPSTSRPLRSLPLRCSMSAVPQVALSAQSWVHKPWPVRGWTCFWVSSTSLDWRKHILCVGNMMILICNILLRYLFFPLVESVLLLPVEAVKYVDV